MRNRRLPGSGLAAITLGLGTLIGTGPAAAASRPGAGASGPCGAFAGAHQLPGAAGVVPAAWPGGGLVVPERYLYDRYGVLMDIATDGDQVAAHYAAGYAGLFTVIKNGAPHRAPAAGDVLSLSADPGFDSASGGHTAVAQSSSVSAAGNGTVTVVEENADAASTAGVLSGTPRAEAAAGTPGRWPITVAVTDTSGATATAGLSLSVAETAAETAAAGNLRHAEWAWHHPGDEGW
jgi:hypothetical protein